MRIRRHISWRRFLVLMPATLVSVAAVALLALLVVLPAVSRIDFLRADRSVPGAEKGALLIIDQIGDGGLAPGDIAIVASLPDGEPQIATVLSIDDGFAVLSQSPGGSTLTLPQADVRLRVTDSIAGFGDAYEFVDSVPGLVTVVGSAVLTWIVTLGLLGWYRRRRVHPSGSPRATASPAAPPLAAVPLLVLERPPLQQQHAASGRPAPVADDRDYAPQHDQVGARVKSIVSQADDLIAFITRDPVRLSPQRWLAEIQRHAPARPANETARWAGLGAVAAVVASATLLVAEESHRRQARRRHVQRPASVQGVLARLWYGDRANVRYG